jgi:hypothetical protein
VQAPPPAGQGKMPDSTPPHQETSHRLFYRASRFSTHLHSDPMTASHATAIRDSHMFFSHHPANFITTAGQRQHRARACRFPHPCENSKITSGRDISQFKAQNKQCLVSADVCEKHPREWWTKCDSVVYIDEEVGLVVFKCL